MLLELPVASRKPGFGDPVEGLDKELTLSKGLADRPPFILCTGGVADAEASKLTDVDMMASWCAQRQVRCSATASNSEPLLVVGQRAVLEVDGLHVLRVEDQGRGPVGHGRA